MNSHFDATYVDQKRSQNKKASKYAYKPNLQIFKNG